MTNFRFQGVLPSNWSVINKLVCPVPQSVWLCLYEKSCFCFCFLKIDVCVLDMVDQLDVIFCIHVKNVNSKKKISNVDKEKRNPILYK